jgi:Xaa-Pro dipeptidase
MWDRFSTAEMDRRYELARELMRAHGLSALVVFGNSGVNRANMANPFWLSNHLDLHHCYLVVPLDAAEETALYTGLTNHVPNAREVSDVPIVEWGGYDPAGKVADRLRELGVSSSRVGLVGVNATFSMGMPYGHHARLRDELPGLELVDVTLPYARLRLLKSEEEVSWLRKGAELTDKAMLALAEGARPGMSDIELVALAEGAYRSEGGMPRIMFLRSMAMDDPNGCLPAQNPSHRRIARGDVIITEFSASYWGYTGQIQRPVFVEAEPTEPWQRMFDVGLAAYDRIVEALKPGATEAEIIRAGSVIGEAGYAIYDDLVHGYGVDIMPPIVDRSCVEWWPWDDARPAPDGRRFEEGMAVVVQPNPITPDERMGLQLGQLTIVRADGAESLHSVPFEPLVAAA